jgi:hypothetical protein
MRLVIVSIFLLSCTGDSGPTGETGVEGPEGPEGGQGSIGMVGDKGDRGAICWDDNENGACDVGVEDTDADGACTVLDCRGPSGVVRVFSFDGFASNVALGSGTVPVQCRTTPVYTAGPNEVATMSFSLTGTGGSADVGSVLIMDGGMSINGVDFSSFTRSHVAGYTSVLGSASSAHGSVHARLALTEGTAYTFGPFIDGAPDPADITCTGFVQIARL